MDNTRRFLFGALLIYVPFAATVSYWLPGNIGLLAQLFGNVFYAAVLLATLIYCLQTRHRFILPQSLKIPLGIVLMLALITLVGANIPQALDADGEQPLLLGLWGLKILIGYMFVVPCVYYLLGNRQDLVRLLRLQVAIILICCGLGIAQYISLRLGICNSQTGGALFKASRSQCLVGGSFLYQPEHGQIRLSGTLASPYQWEWFLITSVFFCFAAALCDRNRYWRWSAWIGMALIWVNAFISGSRLAFWIVPVSLMILRVSTAQLRNWRRSLFFAMGLLAAFALFRISEPGSNQALTIISNWQGESPGRFLLQQLRWALDNTNALWGQGLGRATNSALFLGRTRLIEAYPAKLLYEVGIPGLIAMFGLYTTLVVTLFQSYRQLQSEKWRKCALVLWLFIIFVSYFPHYHALDVMPINLYYWLAAGIILRLPGLENPSEPPQAQLE